MFNINNNIVFKGTRLLSLRMCTPFTTLYASSVLCFWFMLKTLHFMVLHWLDYYRISLFSAFHLVLIRIERKIEKLHNSMQLSLQWKSIFVVNISFLIKQNVRLNWWKLTQTHTPILAPKILGSVKFIHTYR